MNRKTYFVLLGLALVASAGMGQVANDPPGSKIVLALEATPAGTEIDAYGVAAKIRKNGIEIFAAKVSARCDDGEILVVRGARDDGTFFDLGTIVMSLDSGSLELKSSADPSDAFPLEKLAAVSIDGRQGVLLQGKFERK